MASLNEEIDKVIINAIHEEGYLVRKKQSTYHIGTINEHDIIELCRYVDSGEKKRIIDAVVNRIDKDANDCMYEIVLKYPDFSLHKKVEYRIDSTSISANEVKDAGIDIKTVPSTKFTDTERVRAVKTMVRELQSKLTPDEYLLVSALVDCTDTSREQDMIRRIDVRAIANARLSKAKNK